MRDRPSDSFDLPQRTPPLTARRLLNGIKEPRRPVWDAVATKVAARSERGGVEWMLRFFRLTAASCVCSKFVRSSVPNVSRWWCTLGPSVVGRVSKSTYFRGMVRGKSLSDDDPYLELLTDGGYMVERMANLLFQDGTEFGHIVESERAFDETRPALEAGNALSLRPPLFTTICLRGLTFFGERATSCAR